MKLLLFLALVGVVISEEKEKIKSEENVLVVTDDNWDEVVTSHSNVLVDFYAPWCGRCKSLAHEFAKAATRLKELKADISLAKVDATEQTEVANKYGVNGYPTIKFFEKQEVKEYGGGRTSGEIVTWCNRKIGHHIKVLKTAYDLKYFVDTKDVAVVGFFADADSDLAQAFIIAAEAFDVFGLTTTPAVLEEYEVKEDKIVVFKKFDLRADYTGAADVDAITEFVREESLPLVTEFSDENAPKIFGGDIKSHLILFVSKKAKTFKGILATFTIVAKSFKGQVRFVYVDSDVEDNQRILEFFGLKPEDSPTLRLETTLDGYMRTYKPKKQELDEATITSFVKDFVDGKLNKHLMFNLW